jgi:hypothetical protein
MNWLRSVAEFARIRAFGISNLTKSAMESNQNTSTRSADGNETPSGCRYRLPRVRKRTPCIVLVACALAVGYVTYRLSPPPESLPINRSNFDRVQEGMPLAEVEEIFGCPPGVYGHRRIHGP